MLFGLPCTGSYEQILGGWFCPLTKSSPSRYVHFSFHQFNNLNQRQHQRQYRRISSSRRWFHPIDISPPPWSTSPPDPTKPHIRILTHVSQHVSDSTLTYSIGSTCKLANDSDLLVRLQPLRGGFDAFGADGGGDACC